MIKIKRKLDLQRCEIRSAIDAVQGDICSRTIEFSLYSGERPLPVPENPAILIRYKKPDRTGGEYDTLPDGSSAWTFRGNRLTIVLAPQVLTVPGLVDLTVTILSDGRQLSTFPQLIHVLPAAQDWSEDSMDYFNITGFLPAPGNARPGQYLAVSSVDSTGRVTGVRAADIRSGGGGSPSDWNAAEDEPGHIRNRPFYSDLRYGAILPETTPIYDDAEQAFFITECLSLSAGHDYTVRWNGTDYTCTAQEMDGIVLLGNGGALDSTLPGSDDPFVIVAVPESMMESLGVGAMIVSMDGSTELTLSISGVIETIVPIPSKYLTNARGQRKITLNMDAGSASAPTPDPNEIDAAELETALTVIYNGAAHSCILSNWVYEVYDQVTYNMIDFVFSDSQNNHTDLIRGTWSGTQVTFREKRETLHPYDGPRTAVSFYVQPQHGNHCWLDTHNLELDGLLLVSPGNKRFFLTVNDDGTLTTSTNY